MLHLCWITTGRISPTDCATPAPAKEAWQGGAESRWHGRAGKRPSGGRGGGGEEGGGRGECRCRCRCRGGRAWRKNRLSSAARCGEAREEAVEVEAQ